MSVRINGSGWLVDVVVDKSYADFFGIPRRIRAKGFTSEQGAKAYEALVNQAVKDKVALPARDVSHVPKLWDALDATFTKFFKDSPGERTRLSQIKQIKQHMPNVPIDTVTTMMTDDLVEKLRKRYKPASVNNLISVLSKCLIEYARIGVIDVAPKIRRAPSKLKALVTLRPDEEERLLEALRASKRPMVADAVVMYVDTGCRKMELLTLKPHDVDLGLGVIRVTGKTGPRSIPLTDRAKAIAAHYAEKTRPDRRMFPIHESTLSRLYMKALKKAGVSRHLTIHDLRHTFITRLSETGVSPFVIQRLAGHSSLKTTDRYTHLDVSTLRGGIQSLGR